MLDFLKIYQQHVNLHSSLLTEKDFSIGSSVFEFYSNYFFYTTLSNCMFTIRTSELTNPPPTPLPRRRVSNLHRTWPLKKVCSDLKYVIIAEILPC